MKRRSLWLLLFLTVFWTITAGCQEQPQEIPALHEVYAGYFPAGAAVNSWTIHSHRELITKHFNSITPENEMKFDHVQPVEGVFTFERADEIVEFAEENNLLVHGHTLLWHNMTPAWVFRDEKGNPASRELLLRRMEEHITEVVTRYKGKVCAWDVVNEAVADGPGLLRSDSPWYRIIGEDYIAQAFIFAHRADPEARLFYNDYNAVSPAKCDKICRLLKKLLDQGVPVHGVGIQGHWDINHPQPREVEAAIKKYAALGLEVKITELDLSVYAWNDRKSLKSPPAGPLRTQARRYRELFGLFRKYSEVITGVTFWGVADDRTWKDNFPVPGRKDWPLLFDEEHQPKKAFWEIVDF